MSSDSKLGFWGLTALVFGLMVGVGIFNLPQNMAAVASPCAVAVAWLITGAGILPLVMVFRWLSNNYPQYNAGLYQYAQAGFGNLAGFLIAWGYWLCTAFSNVAYGVMLNDAFGAFFPVFLQHGWPTVIFGSALIWLMYFIVARGIHTARLINNILAGMKMLMLLLIIIVFILFFDLDLFCFDTWGQTDLTTSFGAQLKSTMMVTLFCFFGVEGAVMMSARAIRPSDVGKAGIVGFTISLLLYLAVSLLCFGLMTRSNLADLPNPSITYILLDACGPWAYWTVICAIIIALLGGWVSWTLIVAQVPYEASLVKILPPEFSRLNRHGMPAFGLFASSIVMELFLIMVTMADDVYLAALNITGLMIIPGYLFTGLYLLKIADSAKTRMMAAATILFCCWMAYAGGLKELFLTSLFYLAGIGFFIRARRTYFPQQHRIFTVREQYFLALLIIASVISVTVLLNFYN